MIGTLIGAFITAPSNIGERPVNTEANTDG